VQGIAAYDADPIFYRHTTGGSPVFIPTGIECAVKCPPGTPFPGAGGNRWMCLGDRWGSLPEKSVARFSEEGEGRVASLKGGEKEDLEQSSWACMLEFAFR
jgi:hypothetical protein